MEVGADSEGCKEPVEGFRKVLSMQHGRGSEAGGPVEKLISAKRLVVAPRGGDEDVRSGALSVRWPLEWGEGGIQGSPRAPSDLGSWAPIAGTGNPE